MPVKKATQGRSNMSDRGGIRKRGPAKRVDRDGDMAMVPDTSGGRGKKPRGGSSGRGQTRGKTIDIIEKAIKSNNSQANIQAGKSKSNLEQVRVCGWKQSKAASNSDGGVESLLTFLEKKLSPPDSKAGPRVKITKSRVEADALIVFIKPELMGRMLQLNGFSFAGAALTVEKYDPLDQPMLSEISRNGTSASTADTKAKMTAILGRRYYPQNKLLDLSNLGSDPDLMAMGIFNSTSTESKFFPALMKVWEMNFDTAKARQEAVESVSVADNQLANVSAITTLSQSFPNLKNLDLSKNNFKDSQALISWRWKFKHLEFLDLTGSPFSADPEFKNTMLKWYPNLRILNHVEVRTEAEIAAKKETPIPAQAPHFVDESQIAQNFVKAFFPGYDNNRNELLTQFYDNHTTFSFNVNVSAPRSQEVETAAWDSYIKKSRNLQKLTHLPARMSRAYSGVEKIREVWNSLPATRHPDLVSCPAEWLIECYPIPGLPDPTGQSATGVGGLLIMVHGKFDELTTKSKVETRSFDRTFIVGPGGGLGGIRVVSDIFCLRAYGGHGAWVVKTPSAVLPAQPAQPVAPVQPAAAPTAPNGYGMPAPGKADTQVQQEQLVMQLSAKTNMTLQFSELALSGNGWNLDAALKNFEELKAQGQLPPDAFLPGAV